LRAHFNRIGDKELIESVEKDIMHPGRNGAFMMGWIALGISTSTNPLEGKNRHLLRRFKEEIRRLKDSAKLPTSSTIAVSIFESMWWELSNPAQFTKLWMPRHKELKSMRSFESTLARGDGVVWMRNDTAENSIVAVCQKTKFGRFYNCTVELARRARDLWIAGPPVPPKTLTYSDFKLMSSVLFVTTTACYPCWIWGNKGTCYHVEGLRAYLKLPNRFDKSFMFSRGGTAKPQSRLARARENPKALQARVPTYILAYFFVLFDLL
jgi:hypothetical protein